MLAQVVVWFCSKHVSDVSLDRVIPAKGCSSEVIETVMEMEEEHIDCFDFSEPF